jgi:hypothetical protein
MDTRRCIASVDASRLLAAARHARIAATVVDLEGLSFLHGPPHCWPLFDGDRAFVEQAQQCETCASGGSPRPGAAQARGKGKR